MILIFPSSIGSTAHQDSKLESQWPEPSGYKLGEIDRIDRLLTCLQCLSACRNLTGEALIYLLKLPSDTGGSIQKRQMQPCLRPSLTNLMAAQRLDDLVAYTPANFMAMETVCPEGTCSCSSGTSFRPVAQAW